MKIILSPSKTQKAAATGHTPLKGPFWKDATLKLFETLKKMDKETLAKQMKLKGALLDAVYHHYKHFTPGQPVLPAMACYEGVVFQEIKTEDYTEEEQAYMLRHVVILSAMYGVLEPDTVLWPYRLDMTMKPAGINLYHYWQEAVNHYFQEETCIINLASDEFAKMLKPFWKKMLHIHFKEERADGSLQVLSFNAKKARGAMVHQLIKSRLTHPDACKSLSVEGYLFSPEHSSKEQFVYVKPFVKDARSGNMAIEMEV